MLQQNKRILENKRIIVWDALAKQEDAFMLQYSMCENNEALDGGSEPISEALDWEQAGSMIDETCTEQLSW